ncbi:MFS transporter [Rhodococcus sp. 05-340-1]|uniref:MFS transporter n=1 Tax=Nocardiaceae TaxID=85025 RepID=UPI00050C9A4A|nr:MULTISPECIES: MFS transporter [Rhodococcus]OZC87684.1 MFS transporter [Rhodococcus sp. 06-412-2C]OZC96335.1 MFS transporter [Rhodococcus sp. 06-412-2B]OZD65318.1 MFS transporter [Rhodococcus sp. 05-340-2]OZD74635.1 MFS transporter [Rhodococcus sp. 05-340-1]OZD86591.1 MFS transporter [Rhodococcus sp. 05-339-2]
MTATKDVPTANSQAKVVKKVTVAGTIGSFVEWYDYGIYGLLVPTLAIVFAPGGDSSGGIMLTYVGFLVSFLVRPFGGVISGYLGDKFGRKSLLAVLILMISGSTAAIGLIPSFETIGWAAPILLIAMRMIQGFSAGGEVSGAMSFVGEYSDDDKRARTTSWLAMGSFTALLFGSLLSSALISILGQSVLESWAWRIPFLLAVPMGFIGFYIRKRLEDTPHFQALREANTVERNPLKVALTSKRHLKAIAMTIALPALNGPGYYILFVYMPTYLKKEQGFSQLQGLAVTAISLIAILLAIPFAARLSDRIGRKPILLWSAVGMAVTAYPCFFLISQGHMALAALAGCILAFLFAGHAAVIHVQLVELFPTNVRYSAYSIGFNMTTVIFGGSAPLVMNWLIGLSGNKSIPAYAVILTAVITAVATLKLVETAGKPLADR